MVLIDAYQVGCLLAIIKKQPASPTWIGSKNSWIIGLCRGHTGSNRLHQYETTVAELNVVVVYDSFSPLQTT